MLLPLYLCLTPLLRYVDRAKCVDFCTSSYKLFKNEIESHGDNLNTIRSADELLMHAKRANFSISPLAFQCFPTQPASTRSRKWLPVHKQTRENTGNLLRFDRLQAISVGASYIFGFFLYSNQFQEKINAWSSFTSKPV